MTKRLLMYERPRLERYGTFRELTQVSLNLGAFALNSNVVNGSVASCDCLPDDGPGPGTRS
ncbi:MAG: lasso RiPP family leader peptide-containing protein [Gemmatimonadaceae bacterium]|nr:lasso RiPP family leader peptide-containing protein [Gemmatimonadaceae bacterium]